ncbi:MAG: hypothetical protein HKN07_09940 [Acidimicrobiia bacterium]|nr:hypothetical protein [Acidimicrobiia bacterium]
MTFSGSIPNYDGEGLVNLIAELEHRLTGVSQAPRLSPEIAARIPETSTYVLVVFDGLGDAQLDHPAAADLRRSRVAGLDSPFPSTTTVALSTIATGLPASQHGLIGYQLYLDDLDTVVNTIRWTTPWGDPVEYDTAALLPTPNLWERLSAAGAEPISVQPAHFHGSALSNALYRGARFEPIHSIDESIEAAVQLASSASRLILVYLPHVDFAAHVGGQDTAEYVEALRTVSWAWETMAHQMPPGATMLGTADHGHIDFPDARRVEVPKRLHDDRTLYGDVRVVFVKGDGAAMARELPATWIPIAEARHWWGPEPWHPDVEARLPDGLLVADDDYVILPKHSNGKLVGNHGGVHPAERRIPLLVAS